MKTITITAFNRVHYLKQVLFSLVQNDLTGWQIFIALEPSKEQRKIIAEIDRILANYQYKVLVNDTVKGVKNNTFDIQQFAFDSGSDLNIYLEDDTVVSPDITHLADWYAKQDLSNVLCCNLMEGECGGLYHNSDISKPGVIRRTGGFNSLGFIATKNQWSKYLKRFWDSNRLNTEHWDWAVLMELQSRPYLTVFQPALSRANHIGRIGGMHCTASFHDKIFGGLKINQEPIIDNYTVC